MTDANLSTHIFHFLLAISVPALLGSIAEFLLDAFRTN